MTENLSTAVLLAGSVFLLMFVGRVPFKQLGLLAGIGFACIIIGLGTIKYIPGEAWDKIGLHRMVTWQSRLNNHFDESEIPAAKFDIDNDAQIAHANIAIASSHILGKVRETVYSEISCHKLFPTLSMPSSSKS